MIKDEFETKVIFRVFKDGGDVLALFPEIDEGNGLVSSYQHIGQHSGADYTGCIQITRPATPAEYSALKRELESLGYNLKVSVRK